MAFIEAEYPLTCMEIMCERTGSHNNYTITTDRPSSTNDTPDMSQRFVKSPLQKQNVCFTARNVDAIVCIGRIIRGMVCACCTLDTMIF